MEISSSVKKGVTDRQLHHHSNWADLHGVSADQKRNRCTKFCPIIIKLLRNQRANMAKSWIVCLSDWQFHKMCVYGRSAITFRYFCLAMKPAMHGVCERHCGKAHLNVH